MVSYNIPNTISKRGTSFGYGTRYNFAKRGTLVIRPHRVDPSPPPNAYSHKSGFNRSPSTKAFSFGIARDAYNKVSAALRALTHARRST